MNVVILLNWRLSAKLMVLKHYTCPGLALDRILFLQRFYKFLQGTFQSLTERRTAYRALQHSMLLPTQLWLDKAVYTDLTASCANRVSIVCSVCPLFLPGSQLYTPALSLSPSESLTSQLTSLSQLTQLKRFRFLPANQAESVCKMDQKSTIDTLSREGRDMDPDHFVFSFPI